MTHETKNWTNAKKVDPRQKRFDSGLQNSDPHQKQIDPRLKSIFPKFWDKLFNFRAIFRKSTFKLDSRQLEKSDLLQTCFLYNLTHAKKIYTNTKNLLTHAENIFNPAKNIWAKPKNFHSSLKNFDPPSKKFDPCFDSSHAFHWTQFKQIWHVIKAIKI